MSTLVERVTSRVDQSRFYTSRELRPTDLITPEEITEFLDVRPELAKRALEDRWLLQDKSAEFIAFTVLNHAVPAEMDEQLDQSRRGVKEAIMSSLDCNYHDEVYYEEVLGTVDTYTRQLEGAASGLIASFKLDQASKDPSADLYEITEGHSVPLGALTSILRDTVRSKDGPRKPGGEALTEGKKGPLEQAGHPRGGVGSPGRNI